MFASIVLKPELIRARARKDAKPPLFPVRAAPEDEITPFAISMPPPTIKTPLRFKNTHK